MLSVGNLFHGRLQEFGRLENRYDSSHENIKMCDRVKLPDQRSGLAGSRPVRSDQVCLWSLRPVESPVV